MLETILGLEVLYLTYPIVICCIDVALALYNNLSTLKKYLSKFGFIKKILYYLTISCNVSAKPVSIFKQSISKNVINS